MKEIELPFDFNASDSDLEEYRISIPKGFKVEINGNEVILKKKNEDENIRKALISILKSDFEKDTTIFGISVGQIIACLEKPCTLTKLSEKDKEIIDKIIDYMKLMPIFFGSTEGESGEEYTKKFIKNATDWLESLKTRIVP